MLKILVVDDEEKVQRALSALLDEHEVVCCSSVKEAKYTLVMSTMNQFDVIICDERMPEEKGHTLINWCNENSIDSKLIMLTAMSNSQELLSNINEIESVSILGKPWQTQALIDLVTSH